MLIFIAAVSSQVSAQDHRRVPDPTNAEPSRIEKSSPDLNQRVRGTVTLSNGHLPNQWVELNATCPTSRRLIAIGDSRGKFSFNFESNRQSDIDLTNGCTLAAFVEGYRSPLISLSSLNTRSGKNLGKIILEPVSADPNGLTSVTSNFQNKELSKALDKAAAQDWAGATIVLDQILSANPSCSSAWLNLGIVQQAQGKLIEAKASYLKAAEVDPQFAPPLVRAAAIEISTDQRRAALAHSQAAIHLNPTAFPDAYLFNAIANLELHDSDSAERSARSGLALDSTHSYPELDYVLGTALNNGHDPNAAKEHLESYLQRAPNGPNIDSARQQLAQITQVDLAMTQSAFSTQEAAAGPPDLVLTPEQPVLMDLVQAQNVPLLAKPSAYTCIENISLTNTDLLGQTLKSETTRVDVAVFDNKEVFGSPDGKQFSDHAERDLLGDSFRTIGLFSSISRSLIAGDHFGIQPAGQFTLNGEVVLRYNFQTLDGAAGWAITYGPQRGRAAEEGWFLVEAKSLILRRAYVSATNIPRVLNLVTLSALIDYKTETLAGRQFLLPSTAHVEAAEPSGVKRISQISFDRCRAFTANSTLSFSNPKPDTK